MFAIAAHRRREGITRLLSWFEPAFAVPHGNAYPSFLVEWRAEWRRNQKPLVLAPIDARFIPSDPQTILAVDRNRCLRLKIRGAGHVLHRRKVSIAPGAKLHIVVAVRVGVPGRIHSSIGAHRHRRFPFVSRRVAEAHFLGPGAIAAADLEVDITLAVAIALPDYGDLPGRRSGGAV